MTRSWPVIAVADVLASSRWYQTLLGCASPMDASSSHRKRFDQLMDADRSVVLCLQSWEGHELPWSPGDGPVGNGLSLLFIVDDFDAAWERAGALDVPVDQKPEVTPGFRARQFAVRDPDGYRVSIGDRQSGWFASSGLT